MNRHISKLRCRPFGARLRLLLIFLFVAACTRMLLFTPSSLQLEHELRNSTQRHHQRKAVAWERELAEKKNLSERNVNRAIDWSRLDSLIRAANLTENRRGGLKIALVNIEREEALQWARLGETTAIEFERVAGNELTWTQLFPEWIDEEEQYGAAPACPAIPLPEIESSRKIFDLVVARLPCRKPREGWSRDVARLQAHLAAATVAAKAGRTADGRTAAVLAWSSCRPMPDLFRCEDLLYRRGDAWLYRSDVRKLAHKISLPVGSCELAVPPLKNPRQRGPAQGREAFATILHSSEQYACGAIALAQSIRMSNSTKELVVLVDDKIRPATRRGLEAAGWQVREIRRIRNPRAEKDSYNEWNYSKLRLWQLTEYRKIVFVDSDLLVLRNLDFLFDLPEISATGNSRFVFNSGMMVVEPSNCTFKLLMRHRRDVVSYNGGDQGYLNEIFTWWHRLPRRMNYLKHFWSNDSEEFQTKTALFGSDPPELYVLHYLGIKPWLCYRDYDCNWNVENQRAYASDVAHATWWKVHDSMDPQLHRFCLLPPAQKEMLEWDRSQARISRFPDEHWKIDISDPRLRL